MTIGIARGLACALLVAVMVAACGGSTPPSGRYSFSMFGDGMTLNFKDDDNVSITMTDSGETESADCTFKMKGENVTVFCHDGDPMYLTFNDGELETDMGGETVKFTKR